ncbi:Uncharacterized protein APZ42_007727, partial [Daphnia magna]
EHKFYFPTTSLKGWQMAWVKATGIALWFSIKCRGEWGQLRHRAIETKIVSLAV